MKKLKFWSLLSSLIFATSLMFTTNSFAKVNPNNRQIIVQPCYDSEGNVSGYGNTCVTSTDFNCVANPCGHNAQ